MKEKKKKKKKSDIEMQAMGKPRLLFSFSFLNIRRRTGDFSINKFHFICKLRNFFDKNVQHLISNCSSSSSPFYSVEMWTIENGELVLSLCLCLCLCWCAIYYNIYIHFMVVVTLDSPSLL